VNSQNLISVVFEYGRNRPIVQLTIKFLEASIEVNSATMIEITATLFQLIYPIVPHRSWMFASLRYACVRWIVQSYKSF